MTTLDLIGSSSKLRALVQDAEMVAKVDSSVILQGETGTGKEVIARIIHDASPRRNHRFIALNCAAIPTALLESELFGHEKGAFTGAIARAIGRFQAADRGTLFLDEIGDLPLELQPKLLRALQEKEIERLGGGQTLQLDVRVIAATSQNLKRMVEDRKFRADLYYRLNVFPMTLPPLRERREDIPLLVDHFVRKFAALQGKTIETVPDEVMEDLQNHDWPGNIRELQNVIERGVVMTDGPVLSRKTTSRARTEPLSWPVAATRSEPAPIKTLADAERAHILATLHETNWVVGGAHGAATRLGLPRTTLIARMQRLGICDAISGKRSSPPRLRTIEAPRTGEAVGGR